MTNVYRDIFPQFLYLYMCSNGLQMQLCVPLRGQIIVFMAVFITICLQSICSF